MVDLQVYVSEGRDAQLLQFLIHVFDLKSRCEVNIVEIDTPRLETPTLNVKGRSTICRLLALSSSIVSHKQSLGNDPTEAAQVLKTDF